MLLLQEKIGFLSCRCHSPVRNIVRRQLGRLWCLDSGTQMEMLIHMERALPALLWLSQQPTAQKGTQALFPVLGTEGWVLHSCPWAGLADKAGDSKAACTGMSITAISRGYVFWWVVFCGLFFFLFNPDKAFWEIRGNYRNSVFSDISEEIYHRVFFLQFSVSDMNNSLYKP